MISSNTELMLNINTRAVAKYLASNSAEQILASVNSEIKHSMQATTCTILEQQTARSKMHTQVC